MIHKHRGGLQAGAELARNNNNNNNTAFVFAFLCVCWLQNDSDESSSLKCATMPSDCEQQLKMPCYVPGCTRTAALNSVRKKKFLRKTNWVKSQPLPGILV
ncbi:hypothetical protein JOB18_012050 [Solea senegalensis]|uniref:Secreted protein n=1 Tax=Solea senegalensis TaxID=28829 RepID=A0AAV6T548_SOLSE|nr:hypothetical protein JOB18_012050 [Solea senegalensis]